MMSTVFNDYLYKHIDSDEQLKIDNKDIIRLTKHSKYTDEIAKNLMENIVIPFPNFDSFKLSNLSDWYTTSNKYGDSYQLYIHSLRFVNELLIKFEKSKERKYLDKAKEYIESWIEFSRNNTGSNMVWYDHPTAQRTQVIIFYLYLAKPHYEIDQSLFVSILKYHSKFLADNTNYRRNNHGLMMDRSLMILGNILKDESIFNIGYYRSIDTFWHSYSYTGYHLENSPEYHNMVTNMYLELQKYLVVSGKTYGNTIISYLNRASILKNIFAKPNKIIPSIGDSGQGIVKINKRYENFVDYSSGLSIIQDEKNRYFLTFISGYSTITHKHIDDLSFNLFFRDKDFLVDPGKYSYSKHPYRNYVKSFSAHSGIYINNKNYKISDENRLNKKVYIAHHFENNKYVLVKGTNESYLEGKLSRTILYLKKEQITILLDDVESYEDIEVLHNFNFHHKVELIKLNNSSYKLIHGNESIYFKNHTNCIFEKLTGDKYNEPYRALNSIVFNEVVETNQLRNIENLSKQNNSINIYSLSPEEYNFSIDLDDVNNLLIVKFTNYNYIINI